MAMLFIIMKQMMLLVSYVYFFCGCICLDLLFHNHGLIWRDIFFYSFSVSVYCGSIWREVFLVALQSASIAAASGGKGLWFLFSQHLLWSHLAGDKFLVPFKSVMAGCCFGSFSVSIYCGHIWQEISFCFFFKSEAIVSASGGKFCFWFLSSQHPLMPHLAGS